MTELPAEPVPEDWAKYRTWLRLLAGAGLDRQLQKALDPSDIVQQTLLQAVQAQAGFQGTTERERLAWLRQILVRTLTHAVRDHRREKRDIRREHSIEEAMQSSAVRVASILQGDTHSPLAELLQSEEVFRLCQSLDRLTDPQRQAIELHYWQGQTISEIATEMDRTPAAVAGLLKRGLKELRTVLRRETGDSSSEEPSA